MQSSFWTHCVSISVLFFKKSFKLKVSGRTLSQLSYLQQKKSSLSLVNSSPSCYIFSNFVWKGSFTTHGTFIHLFPSFSETTIRLPLDFLCEVACSNESPASNCTHIRRITSHLLLRNVTQSRRSMSNQQSSAVWHSRQMQVQKRHTLKNLNVCVGLWVF